MYAIIYMKKKKKKIPFINFYGYKYTILFFYVSTIYIHKDFVQEVEAPLIFIAIAIAESKVKSVR